MCSRLDDNRQQTKADFLYLKMSGNLYLCTAKDTLNPSSIPPYPVQGHGGMEPISASTGQVHRLSLGLHMEADEVIHTHIHTYGQLRVFSSS